MDAALKQFPLIMYAPLAAFLADCALSKHHFPTSKAAVVKFRMVVILMMLSPAYFFHWNRCCGYLVVIFPVLYALPCTPLRPAAPAVDAPFK